MFNLALLLQRKNRYAEASDYWRRYLAADRQSEWSARARRSLKFCEMQVHLVASFRNPDFEAQAASASSVHQIASSASEWHVSRLIISRTQLLLIAHVTLRWTISRVHSNSIDVEAFNEAARPKAAKALLDQLQLTRDGVGR